MQFLPAFFLKKKNGVLTAKFSLIYDIFVAMPGMWDIIDIHLYWFLGKMRLLCFSLFFDAENRF